VREELGVSVLIDHLLGTTHFYRGTPTPENELVGVIYLCSLADPSTIHLSPEHSEFRWLSADRALELLSASDATTDWARRVLQRAMAIRPLLPENLVKYQQGTRFEFG
jgi:8-oxo-dGTP pyrophosphatase MutT (NUDIX family)